MAAADTLESRFGLAGELVLITGSTLGIGKAAAKAFLVAGASVLINGRKEDAVNAVVEEFNATFPGKALPAVGDVSTEDGVKALVDAVEATGQPLDVLVANVGIFEVKPFMEVPDSDWQKFFDTNIMGTVRPIRAFFQGMLDRNKGSIIIVSSEAGIRGFASMPHYGMTKAAQLSLSRSLADTAAGTNVRVNAVCPGPTWTEGVDEYIKGIATQKGITPEEAAKDYFKGEPTSLIQRFLTPDEIANTILFYGSNASTGTTGAAVLVEGGIVATAI